ncbi:MAG: hypothetical protein C0168_04820 [Candidatus Aminicenantes bacterium]|nr:MAG: hypothetical protein C0168_04820 [Candidatus Aminicenantes bacterium]
MTPAEIINYNQIAGWRGILLSPASFSLKTLAPHQPAFFCRQSLKNSPEIISQPVKRSPWNITKKFEGR